jgi:ABC-type glycerol-3-phosphate transport system substrate-binding protein
VTRRALLLVLVSLATAGCGRGGDLAPVPPGLEAKVGIPRPWFAFVAARCRADGGIAIIFAEQGFGADGDFAYAMQGGGAIFDGWGGGIGIDDPAVDEELVRFFDEVPEVPCPNVFP